MLWGAALGRAVIYVNNVSGLEWKPCPDPPEVHGSLPVDGHETTSLEGTQASGAGESHTQEANVAEVSYGKPVNGESEDPEKVRTTRRRAIRGHARLMRPINR